MTNQTTERRRHPFHENGARIRSARRRVGLSQEVLAEKIGTTRRHMIRLENGEHLPSGELRDRIAETTGQPASSIQSSDDEEESVPRRSLADDLHQLARVAAVLERQPGLVDELLAAEVHA